MRSVCVCLFPKMKTIWNFCTLPSTNWKLQKHFVGLKVFWVAQSNTNCQCQNPVNLMKNKNTCRQIQIHSEDLTHTLTHTSREIYPIMCCAHIDLSIETHFWLGLDILKYSHTHSYELYAKWQTNRSQIQLVLVTGETKVVNICVQVACLRLFVVSALQHSPRLVRCWA